MKTLLFIFCNVLFLFTACKREGRPSGQHPLYGDSIVAVLPNGDSVIQDEEGNVIRTIYTPFGSQYANTSFSDTAIPIGVEQPYYISGKLAGGAGASITLDLLRLGTTMKPLYTQTVNKQELFDFEGMTSVPQMMQLRVPAGSVHFIIKPGDSIHLDLDLQTVVTYGIKGSPESEHLFFIYTNILEKANEKKHEIEHEIDETSNMEQKGQLMALRAGRIAVIEKQKYKDLKDYINRIGTSYAALAAAMYLMPEEDIEFLTALDEKFAKIYPNSELYEGLREKVVAYAPFRVGNKALEILLPTPDGKDARLSDLKGKYVLLHFWSSYSGKNKESLSHLKKLYDKYNSHGFEIFSVSLDSKREDWVNAIKDYNLNWLHVSDLQAQKSQAVQTYLISNIPMTYLLDKEGRILARDIHGEALEKKLDSIF